MSGLLSCDMVFLLSLNLCQCCNRWKVKLFRHMLWTRVAVSFKKYLFYLKNSTFMSLFDWHFFSCCVKEIKSFTSNGVKIVFRGFPLVKLFFFPLWKVDIKTWSRTYQPNNIKPIAAKGGEENWKFIVFGCDINRTVYVNSFKFVDVSRASKKRKWVFKHSVPVI